MTLALTANRVKSCVMPSSGLTVPVCRADSSQGALKAVPLLETAIADSRSGIVDEQRVQVVLLDARITSTEYADVHAVHQLRNLLKANRAHTNGSSTLSSGSCLAHAQKPGSTRS